MSAASVPVSKLSMLARLAALTFATAVSGVGVAHAQSAAPCTPGTQCAADGVSRDVPAGTYVDGTGGTPDSSPLFATNGGSLSSSGALQLLATRSGAGVYVAKGSSAIFNGDVSISALGPISDGVVATDSATAQFDGGLTVQSQQSHGLRAVTGGTIILNGTANITALADYYGTGILVANGGKVIANQTALITAAGANVSAIEIASGNLGSGDLVELAGGGSVSVVGNNAHGVHFYQVRPTQSVGTFRMSGGTVSSAQGYGFVASSAALADVELTGVQVNGGLGLLNATDAGTSLSLVASASSLNGNADVVNGAQANVSLLNGTQWTGQATNLTSLSLSDSKWTMTGSSDVGALSLGNGVIAYQTPTTGDYKTLTVHGDFTSNGGLLMMNTQLGDDRSGTDKLHVEGNTSGNAFVAVNNVGGLGAATADGIQLIQVDGQSNGSFSLSGRAVAGEYEYFLFKGGASRDNAGDWYLRSELPIDPPVDPPIGPPIGPGPGPAPEPILRPEPGAYLANENAAINLFWHSWQDRQGTSSQGGDDRGAWARATSTRSDYGQSSAQINGNSDVSVLQLGTDVLRWGERTRVGVMLGTGRASSQSTSNLTGYSAKGVVNGQAVGIYGTWLQRPADGAGAYLDTWVQYGRYQNSVQGTALAQERYDAHTISGSVESGYSLPVFSGQQMALYVQPQLQLTYTNYSAGSHTEANGTVVTTESGSGVTTRAGVRIYGHSMSSEFSWFKPFAAFNWIRGTAVAMRFDAEQVTSDIPRNRYEVIAGVQARLGKRWSASGQAGFQFGANHYRSAGAQLRLTYNW